MDPKNKFFELKNVTDISGMSGDDRVILSDQLTSSEVLSLYLNKNADHVVQKSSVQADNELRLSLYTLNSPELFIKYPLSVITGDENPTEASEKAKAVLSSYLASPSDKESVLENLETFLAENCKRSSIIADIRIAADELISNSLFNAPYVNSENSNSTVNRDYSMISIDQAKKPHVFAGCDEDRVIIGCTDFYGKLNIKKLIERIKLCYDKNPGEMINFDAGGAGIGSYLVFDTCMSYYLAVDPGKTTTVCCTFPLNMSAHQRNKVPKNVHVIKFTD